MQNGVPRCAHAGSGACDAVNTNCVVDHCDPGWFDLDKKVESGCEYRCAPAADGKEICDDKDNDCDGLIDQFDPNQIGRASCRERVYVLV